MLGCTVNRLGEWVGFLRADCPGYQLSSQWPDDERRRLRADRRRLHDREQLVGHCERHHKQRRDRKPERYERRLVHLFRRRTGLR